MAQRCTAHRTNGEPCSAWAMKGQKVCVTHGGAARQSRQAAERTLALGRAERMVQLAGVDMDPIDHLLDSLYRQAALVAAYGIVVGELGDDELTRSNKVGDASLHPFLVAYERANSERARIAKLCGDLKVGERQVQLAERMGEQFSTIFERTWQAVDGLSEAQRLQAAKAYARVIGELERPTVDGTARDVA